MRRACVAGFAALVSLAGVAHGRPDRCQPALPSLQSDTGATFSAQAYGIAKWHTSANGRRLPYAVHVWKGKSGGKPAYLTFNEIPGTSGPNYHLDRNLSRIPAKIDWTAKRDFAFDPRVIIRSGALAGDWKVTNCAER